MKGTLTYKDCKLLDCVWFDSMGCTIGIVLVLNETGIVSFIGRAGGISEAEDAIHIMTHGAPFPIKAASSLFGDEINCKSFVHENEIIECYLKLMMKSPKQVLYDDKD